MLILLLLLSADPLYGRSSFLPNLDKVLEEHSRFVQNISMAVTTGKAVTMYPEQATKVQNDSEYQESKPIEPKRRKITIKRQSELPENLPDIKIEEIASVSVLGKAVIATEFRRFRKQLAFAEIEESIFEFFKVIDALDPETEKNRPIIKGKRDNKKFELTTISQPHGLLKEECQITGTTMASMNNIWDGLNEVPNVPIVLLNTIELGIDPICVGEAGVVFTGTTCVRELLRFSRSSGHELEFGEGRLEEEELREQLMKVHREVYNIVLENNKTRLMYKAKGYALCVVREDVAKPTGEPKYQKVLQTKFFSVLANHLRKILQSMDKQVNVLQHAFLLLIREPVIGVREAPDFTKMCSFLNDYWPTTCSQALNNKEPGLDKTIESFRNDTLRTDQYFIDMKKVVKDLCASSSGEGGNVIAKVYHELLALHLSLRQLLEIDHFILQAPIIYLDASSQDIKACVLHAKKQALSNEDVLRIYLQISNIKTFFIEGFKDILPDLEELKIVSVTSGPRVRKWVYTDPLAYITGLASRSQFSNIETKQRVLIQHEKKVDKELASLHQETIEILNFIGNESASIAQLINEETKLEKSLEEVIQDEEDVSKKISHIMKALEINSDLQIQYGALEMQTELLTQTINELKDSVESLAQQLVHVALFPLRERGYYLRALHTNSLRFTEIKGFATDSGFYLEYLVPVVNDPFIIFKVESIPFIGVNERVWKLDVSDQPIAVNSIGHLFEFTEKVCRSSGNVYLCVGSSLQIQSTPQDCRQEIIVKGTGLGPLCMQNLHIMGGKLKQEKIYKHVGDKEILLFSPYDDELFVQCQLHHLHHNNANMTITKGLNRIQLPQNCFGKTKELIIYPETIQSQSYSVLSASATPYNITEDFDELAEAIQDLHNINFTVMDKHLQAYLNESQVESVKIKELTHTLNTFKTIKKLNEYSITDGLNLDEDDNLTTTVSIISWIFSTLLLLLLIAGCVYCCPCCAPVRAFFSCLCSCCQCLTKKGQKLVDAQLSKLEETEEINLSRSVSLEPDSKKNTKRTKEPKKTDVVTPKPEPRTFKRMKTPLDTSQSSLDTSQTDFSFITEPADPSWFLYKHKSDYCQIRALYKGVPLQYNWITNRVEKAGSNEFHHEYLSPPSFDQLSEAIKHTSSLSPPILKPDERGLYTVAWDSDIYYNKHARQYHRIKNGRIVCGIRLPPIQKEPEYLGTVETENKK